MYISDIDECSYKASNPCPTHSQCINYMGSYSCHCDFGYEAVGSVCEGNNMNMTLPYCGTMIFLIIIFELIIINYF